MYGGEIEGPDGREIPPVRLVSRVEEDLKKSNVSDRGGLHLARRES